MPKITVVFDYSEGAELPKKLTAAFATEAMEFDDVTISEISMGDEISRIEELENIDVEKERKTDGVLAAVPIFGIVLFLLFLAWRSVVLS